MERQPRNRAQHHQTSTQTPWPQVGHALDASLQSWADQSRRLALPKGEALALHLAPLETVPGLEELRETVEKLREIWQVKGEVLDPCRFTSFPWF